MTTILCIFVPFRRQTSPPLFTSFLRVMRECPLSLRMSAWSPALMMKCCHRGWSWRGRKGTRAVWRNVSCLGFSTLLSVIIYAEYPLHHHHQNTEKAGRIKILYLSHIIKIWYFFWRQKYIFSLKANYKLWFVRYQLTDDWEFCSIYIRQ